MEYGPLDESQKNNESFHKRFNASIRSGDIIVIDANTLLYTDGRMETSRAYTYLFDEETQEFNCVPLSSYEYYKKNGKVFLRFHKLDK